MKIRWMLIVLFLFVSSPSLFADDAEKLDRILNELQELNGRVKVLERQVSKLTAAVAAQNQPAVIIRTIDELEPLNQKVLRRRINLPSKQVEEVLRLQIESPGTLLEGIHERERMLRNRIFMPEFPLRQ